MLSPGGDGLWLRPRVGDATANAQGMGIAVSATGHVAATGTYSGMTDFGNAGVHTPDGGLGAYVEGYSP